MLAVVGTLAGVLMGFGLSVGYAALQERKRSAVAARLVFFEFAENLAALDLLLSDGEWLGVKRAAWDAHAPLLSPKVNDETVRFLSYLYARLAYADWIAKAGKAEERRNELENVSAECQRAWEMLAEKAGIDEGAPVPGESA